MKAAVPANTKIGKDAKECVQECVSEFISFITSEAAERSLVEKRKTIGGEDILYAMGTLGFDDYAEVLKIYLAKLREVSTVGRVRRGYAVLTQFISAPKLIRWRETRAVYRAESRRGVTRLWHRLNTSVRILAV